MTEYEEAKARQTWHQIRSGQRDFFLTSEFLAERIRQAEQESAVCNRQASVLLAGIGLMLVFLYFWSR